MQLGGRHTSPASDRTGPAATVMPRMGNIIGFGLNRFDWTSTEAFADDVRRAEELGFSHALVPWNPLSRPDPYMQLVVAAGRTSRIRLGLLLDNPVLHHPRRLGQFNCDTGRNRRRPSTLDLRHRRHGGALAGIAPGPDGRTRGRHGPGETAPRRGGGRRGCGSAGLSTARSPRTRVDCRGRSEDDRDGRTGSRRRSCGSAGMPRTCARPWRTSGAVRRRRVEARAISASV